MTAFRITLTLAVLLLAATVAFLLMSEQRHWAILTGFSSAAAFFAAADEA